ncbi:MAG TPA: SBBP repeat-containing protein, partial [Bryobacteraceae bacterium]|nr:SBBP repeat-containing protein [Bryobacteraceae bacterium]
MSTGTNRGYRPGVALTLCALLTIAGSAFAKSSSATVAGNYGKLPLHFEENKGQADPSVRYLSRGSGYALLLGPQQATLSLVRNSGRAVVRLNFVGSSGASSVRAEGALPGSSNYFIGSDPSRWIHGSKHFGKVVYDSLYPGVNAVFYGNQKQLEYDLVVAPGADPKQIRLSFEGADALKVNANGDLVLSTAVGELIQKAPLVYQEIGKKRRTVRSHYVLEDGRVTFALAKYDVRRPLVIDPVLLYSSYLGGSGEDEVRGIALDTNRAAVLVGRTASNDFGILPNGLLRGTTDAFLIKLGVNGNTVINATYFGGAQDDAANAVALDAQGNVLVVGSTTSGTDPNKFPVTNTFQNQIGGAQDGFFIKFNAGTNAIAHATFIGGFGTDDARGVAVAPDGTAHVVGSTNSFNLGPFGAFQAVFGQGESDGFYFRFSPEGFRLSSSYLGGESADAANAVAVDSAGAAYITGETRSVSFPLTAGVFQNRVNGCTASAFNCSQFSDAFITKVAPGGAALTYSTYLGGDKNERGTDIAVDATFNAYVTGETDSANLPILGAFQAGYAGATDSFITKFNPTGTNRIYLSYYGGSGDDRARSIAVDPTGAAVVVGATSSTDLPLTNFFQPANGGGVDAFVTVVSPAGNMRSLSTYVGASDNDDARAVAVDANGNAYVAGQTSSATFPTLNPVQSSFAGVSDGFVFKMSNCAIGINPTGVTVGSGTAGGVITITGPSDCPWSASTNDNWITFQGDTAGVGPGFLTSAIQANIGVPRVGTITIGGQVFTVTQLGAPIEGCVFPPNPANLIAPDEGITGTFL